MDTKVLAIRLEGMMWGTIQSMGEDQDLFDAVVKEESV